jgi:hypothetical protein
VEIQTCDFDTALFIRGGSDFHQKFLRLEEDLWDDQGSQNGRLGIISLLGDVDWEEWVWLVAFARLFVSPTKVTSHSPGEG